jgi:hypothetical protein
VRLRLERPLRREFDALDVAEIVDGVRSGALLKMQPPFYYAIKSSHISTREVRKIVSGTAVTYKLRGAHHVLSAWPR